MDEGEEQPEAGRNARRLGLWVRGTCGFVAGVFAGVYVGVTWVESPWLLGLVTLGSGALCAYLAATRGDRFWESLASIGWP